MQGSLALKLAQMMVELFRGNHTIIDQISPEQLDAFVTQLRITKVKLTFHFHITDKSPTFHCLRACLLFVLLSRLFKLINNSASAAAAI